MAVLANRYQIKWDLDDPATPALLDAMMDDIGEKDKGAREAVKAWCIRCIGECKSISMGDLQNYANIFLEGYKVGLKVAE